MNDPVESQVLVVHADHDMVAAAWRLAMAGVRVPVCFERLDRATLNPHDAKKFAHIAVVVVHVEGLHPPV